MRFGLVIALALLSGCSGLKAGYFVKGGVRYRVAAPDAKGWKPVSFADNDLAWVSPQGHLLAMNATCENHGDPSLEVLTTHLLMGFAGRELKDRQLLELDGREALASTYDARLDGVEVELSLVVLKKDGCVHDFSYVSPRGRAAERRADFDGLVDGFTTTDGAPPPRRKAQVQTGAPTIEPEATVLPR